MDLFGAIEGSPRRKPRIVFKIVTTGNASREENRTVDKGEKFQDGVAIKDLSFEQRLNLVQQQHEATDYSNMTDAEKMRVIDARFETVFPSFSGLTSGILGGWMVENTRPYDRMVGAHYGQISDVIVSQPIGSSQLFREAHYDGMSDDEIRKAVNMKYTGGSMIDRAGAIHELLKAGVLESIGSAMVRTMFCQARDATRCLCGSNLNTTHPDRMNAMYQSAAHTSMNWTQLTQSTLQRTAKGTYRTPGVAESEAIAISLKNLEEKLSEFLDQMLKYQRED